MQIRRPAKEIPDNPENPRKKQAVLAHRVGGYYEDLGRLLLRGFGREKRLPQNHKSGDLYHEGLNTWLEVKASSNSRPFRVFWSQLQAHAEEAKGGFPTDSYLYLMFGYKNRERRNGKSRHILADGVRDQRELELFLAEHTQVCYVVDVRILAAINQTIGIREDKRRSDWAAEEHRRYVPITRAQLRELATNPRAEFRKLGLQKEIRRFLEPRRGSIDPISISLRFHQRQVKFQLFCIVPTTMRKKIEKLVLGNGNGQNGDH